MRREKFLFFSWWCCFGDACFGCGKTSVFMILKLHVLPKMHTRFMVHPAHHAHTHTRTHIHTHIHTHLNKHTHIHTPHTHTYTHHTHTPQHTHIHTHTPQQTHTYTHHTHTYTHTPQQTHTHHAHHTHTEKKTLRIYLLHLRFFESILLPFRRWFHQLMV